MSFQKAESSNVDTDEFLIGMINNPKDLEIVDISELKTSDNSKEGYQYFYIKIKDMDSKEKVRLSFNVKVNEDNSIYIGQGAKIYPLLSYVSNIRNEGIVCFKEDIDEALDGLTFKAKTIRKKFGRKPYFVLVPIGQGDE